VIQATRVKICCVASTEEAQLARDAGARALGLVSAMPSGPGVLSDQRVAAIATAMDGQKVRMFLFTSRVNAAVIAQQRAAASTTTLQLVDELLLAERRALRGLCIGAVLRPNAMTASLI
jgi:phosphoribosylanthranilate isomerase